MADEPLEKGKMQNNDQEQDREVSKTKPPQQNRSQEQGAGRFRGQARSEGQRRQRPSHRPGGTYRRAYRTRHKVCPFCVDKTKEINWKNFENLRRFVNEGGGMRSRRKTGTCAKHQRRLAVAIKRARHMALFPYTIEHVRIMSKG